MDRTLSLKLKDEEFIFDCRRGIYWPRSEVLLVTDLHWGKTTYMQQHGIAISDKVFEEDLKRLSHLLEDYEVKTLLVLGDMIHHEKALSRGVIERVAQFRHENPCELILVKGNHDRYTEFPESWGVVEEKDFRLRDFTFTHETVLTNEKFNFSGHTHPMMRFKAGFDQIRLPSFILSQDHCLLPAFSHLTGGQDIKLKTGEKAIALLSDGLELFEKN